MCKLITNILTNRLQIQLDENQPIEEAVFRSGYSTIGHTQSTNHKPMSSAFVDYEEAFNSTETNAVLSTLQNQGIDQVYTDVLARIQENGYAKIDLHKQGNAIPIRRGVGQGDTISPMLFRVCLKEILRKLNWSDTGISIHGWIC